MLKARADVTKVEAQFGVFRPDDESLLVLVDGFRKVKGKGCQGMQLGLVQAFGLDGTLPLAEEPHEGYLLNLDVHNGNQLVGIRDGRSVELPSADSETAPRTFAVGCMRSLLNIVQRHKRPKKK